jgi:hypothetical protein
MPYGDFFKGGRYLLRNPNVLILISKSEPSPLYPCRDQRGGAFSKAYQWG